DCAQSFDVRWQGNLVAAHGDAAILAFGIGKAMTALFGGALLTNRRDIAQTVQNYRDHSFRSSSMAHSLGRLAYFAASWLAVNGFGVNATDFVERLGALNAFRSRESIRLPNDNSVLMPRCQAAMGNAQLPRLPAFIKRRKEISAIYERALHDACGVRLPAWHEGATHTIYTLRLDEALRRTDMLNQLRRRGVQGGTVLDYVVPDLECYRERGNADDFPNARAWARRALNLPNHPTLSDAQVEQCASALRRALAASQSR
ncbi:partial dTDP-4-amino-4,6-dideoxy-D-glucose transaminase, partial [Anaerolineae bacterium]